MPALLRTILAKLEVDQTKTGEKASMNDGSRPTPDEACTWGIMDFFAVMPWNSFSIFQWTVGSMLLSLGLTVPQAIGVSIVSNFIITITSIAAGHVGVVYRLSDPLSSRLVWGVRGYAITLVCQIGMATCYYGIQIVYGYFCVKVVIGAMAPSFITMRNTLSDDIPTNDFICLVVFVVISAILQAFGIGFWRYLGKYGAVLTLITFVTIVAVCCSGAGGVGPLLRDPYELVGIGRKPSSAEVVWGFFLALSSLLANNAMLFEGNYTRFAKSFKAPLPAQIICRMFLPLLVTVFGILTTSAAVEVFPDENRLLWAPYEVLLAYQMKGGAGVRAATFFGALVLIIPQLGINIASGAYTTGINYSTLFPRWFTIRRGGYLTLVLAVVINPWQFAAKPTGFNRFLNGSGILYGCLCGMFLVDYFVIRRRLVKVSDLLKKEQTSIYWYSNGFNWRAIVAVLSTVWIPFPGWVMVIGNSENVLNNPWEKIYGLAWMLCFVLASLVYYTLNRIWPMSGVFEVDSEEGKDIAASTESTEEKPSAV